MRDTDTRSIRRPRRPGRPGRPSIPGPSRLALPLAAAAAALLLALPATAQPQPPGAQWELRPSIAVSGLGEVRIEPDQAMVRLGVVAQAETARAAQDEVNRTANAILEAVERAGIPEAAIQTERLMLHPVYAERVRDPREMGGGGYQEPEIVAYRASNVVSVRVDDLAKIGPVIDAGIGAGANQVEGVDFRLRDESAARRQALVRAVEDGRHKAEAIAGALNVALGPVVQADEGGVNFQFPMYDRPMYARAEMAQAAAPTPVAPGEITVTANVTLRYLIPR